MKIDSIMLNRFPESIKIQNNEQGKVSFSDVLKESIQKVTELEKEADKEVEKLAKMESQDIHNTMMAIEKADLTFQMMMQIRNKIITAYEEIMRMQV
ncbi:MAG: flagellar hook-basal body complex protein FliE [Syntrophorhabdaceae bacterium]|jgi:flagellar hook-basal body complex protein FliE|nr:flagellar hook-basal body complex protein FliE [Syntrophorhabdaceae bacterium]MDD5243912.1 flagellar hook-basal body complex protein FliE [Syntrophorhabdaceae bacterium]